MAAEDPTVSRFLVREAGFDIVGRERAAVNEWVWSERIMHVMRDSTLHDRYVCVSGFVCVCTYIYVYIHIYIYIFLLSCWYVAHMYMHAHICD